MSHANITHLDLFCGVCDARRRVRVDQLGDFPLRSLACWRCGIVGTLHLAKVIRDVSQLGTQLPLLRDEKAVGRDRRATGNPRG
jgi:hypothetical protein